MHLPASFWKRAALLILLAAPPLFAGLGAADCEYHMEVMTLASSHETWMRMQSDPNAWRIPSWNGAPRVNKPPLTVWINALLWRGLDPASDPVDAFVLRARLMTAGLALCTLFAIWRIGAQVHSGRFGWLAAAITGTSLLFLRNMRIATYDAYLLAFATLAIASAVYAMRPREPERARSWSRLIGWVGCGACVAAAYLTKGPISLVMTVLPLACMIAATPAWRRHALGLALAVALAGALAAPWFLYILREVPAAVRALGAEYRAARDEFQPPWYYLGLIPLVAPWVVWLPAFWAQAIRRRIDWSAPAIRVAALWFLAIFVVMSIPAAKQQRYIIPILPAAGLLMAALFLGVGERERAPWLGRLAAAHGWLLIAASALIGLFGLLHPLLLSSGALKQPEIARLPPWSLAVLAVPLAGIAHAALRDARRLDLERVALRTALWMTVVATPLLYDYAHTHHGRYPQRGEVEAIMRLVGDRPLRYAETPELPDSYEAPDGKMLLYARRVIPRWTNADGAPAGYLMAARHDGLHQELEQAGWRAVAEFHDGNLPRRLYRARDSETSDR
jgi:4-amino-4-deoxy-L-arabinose transferase-like glycosyltransferase